MRDLIERVAEKAGWPVTFDVDDLSSPYVAVGNDWIYVEKGELTPAGLVFLLRELLDADGTVPIMKLEDGRFSVASYDEAKGDSLEEAVMRAFLHKGER